MSECETPRNKYTRQNNKKKIVASDYGGKKQYKCTLCEEIFAVKKIAQFPFFVCS